jgi:hypothetical protein
VDAAGSGRRARAGGRAHEEPANFAEHHRLAAVAGDAHEERIDAVPERRGQRAAVEHRLDIATVDTYAALREAVGVVATREGWPGLDPGSGLPGV